MEQKYHYSVAIRTLGTAGKKYSDMICSLERQTLLPDAIFVYIAEGYPLPDQLGGEIYVRTPKGMVTQRARPYQEIDSEYLLLCDDDVLFEPDSVERLFSGLKSLEGDAISANVYDNHRWPFKEKVIQAAFHGYYPSILNKYVYRIRRSGYFSYCLHPREVMETQCFAGACILLSKEVFLSISLQEEQWMDQVGYPLGEDMVFAYKLHRFGYKVLVHSHCGVVHQDAQSSHEPYLDKDFYQSSYIRYMIWYRTVYQPAGRLARPWCAFVFYCRWSFRFLLAVAARLAGRNRVSDKDMRRALRYARKAVRSLPFTAIPAWDVVR